MEAIDVEDEECRRCNRDRARESLVTEVDCKPEIEERGSYPERAIPLL
jgi:hypothetical protein